MERKPFTFMKSKYLPYVAAFMTMTATFLPVIYLDLLEHEKSRQQEMIHVMHKLESMKANLEGRVNTAIAYTYSIVAYISTHHDISRSHFEQVAGGLIAHGSNIRGISIAKDNIINLAYPPEDAKPVMGMNFLNVPEQREAWQRAIDTRRAVVAGPVDLVEKGFGFIPRTPVYLTPSNGTFESGRYWGMVSVIMDMSSLFTDVGITDSKDLKIAIRGRDAKGSEGDIFFGDKRVFDSDPVLLRVVFPEGSWQMAAVPVMGWSVSHQGHKWFMAGWIVLPLLSGSLVWVLMQQPITLRREIERVTNALKAAEERERNMRENIEREERKRLDMNLHDGIGQALMAVKLNLQMLRAGNVPLNANTLTTLIDEISSSTDELRHILSNLSPLPPDADIVLLARQFGARMAEKSGIPINITIDGDLSQIQWKVKENIYRIYQEALNNAVKHSGAKGIEVKLSVKDGHLFMTISDNGKGIDSWALEGMTGGCGLSSMRERVNIIGGDLLIDNHPGGGTIIRVKVAL